MCFLANPFPNLTTLPKSFLNRRTKGVVNKITAAELANMQACGSAQLIDICSPTEYASGHVPRAINIPGADRRAHCRSENGCTRCADLQERAACRRHCSTSKSPPPRCSGSGWWYSRVEGKWWADCVDYPDRLAGRWNARYAWESVCSRVSRRSAVADLKSRLDRPARVRRSRPDLRRADGHLRHGIAAHEDALE